MQGLTTLAEVMTALETHDEELFSPALTILADTIEYGGLEPALFRDTLARLVQITAAQTHDPQARGRLFSVVQSAYLLDHEQPTDFSLAPLLDWLGRGDEDWRVLVLATLKLTGDPAHIPAATAQLEHASPRVVAAAQSALVALVSWDRSHDHAALVQRCLEPMIAQLARNPFPEELDRNEPARARSLLLRLDMLPVLGDASTRALVLRGRLLCMALTSEERHLATIARYLDAEEPSLRARAWTAWLRLTAELAIFRQPVHAAALERALGDADQARRAEALRAMGYFLHTVSEVWGNTAYLPLLQRYAQHADSTLREPAQAALLTLR